MSDRMRAKLSLAIMQFHKNMKKKQADQVEESQICSFTDGAKSTARKVKNANFESRFTKYPIIKFKLYLYEYSFSIINY